jgi:hypothetical protein
LFGSLQSDSSTGRTVAPIIIDYAIVEEEEEEEYSEISDKHNI